MTEEAEAIPGAVEGVRWRALLPVIMTVLSVLLMLLAKRQQPKMGIGWEVPARVVNTLINGPGFYFGRLIPTPIPNALNEGLSYDADRILGIAFFWFLIGLSVERRRNKQALDQQNPIHAVLLFTFASLVCGVFGLGGIDYVFCPSPNQACWNQGPMMVLTVLRVVAKYPLRTSHTMVLSTSVWLLALCAYFAKRAFIAARRLSGNDNGNVPLAN